MLASLSLQGVVGVIICIFVCMWVCVGRVWCICVCVVFYACSVLFFPQYVGASSVVARRCECGRFTVGELLSHEPADERDENKSKKQECKLLPFVILGVKLLHHDLDDGDV